MPSIRIEKTFISIERIRSRAMNVDSSVHPELDGIFRKTQKEDIRLFKLSERIRNEERAKAFTDIRDMMHRADKAMVDRQNRRDEKK